MDRCSSRHSNSFGRVGHCIGNLNDSGSSFILLFHMLLFFIFSW